MFFFNFFISFQQYPLFDYYFLAIFSLIFKTVPPSLQKPHFHPFFRLHFVPFRTHLSPIFFIHFHPLFLTHFQPIFSATFSTILSTTYLPIFHLFFSFIFTTFLTHFLIISLYSPPLQNNKFLLVSPLSTICKFD